ncbi:MAG: excinuclease ABC subunit UvrC [Armatimonadetes bacterium]|nr:excinuclease ABC subunit UvrC [Armatimonadota bacterium]
MALDQTLANLPVQPGCYLMRDARRKVLYVGKATSLRSRVRSYFQAGAQHSPRIAQMVCQVDDVNYIVTASEVEALILEAELIKRYRPRYNIRLRDDKRYPLLKFTREPFPQLVECRQTRPDGARYFGPYTNSSAMRAFERLIRRLFHIRRCTYALDADSRLRPCLDHHLGLCDAPCAGLIDETAYAALVDASADLLRGRVDALLADLEAQMAAAAANLEFERAAALRDLLADVRKASAQQQRVVSGRVEDIDVLATAQHEDISCVKVLFVREGRVLGDHHAMLEGTLQDTADVPLRAFIMAHYAEASELPPTLLLSNPIEDPDAVSEWLSKRAGRRVEVAVPQRGDKRQLMDMARQNAEESLRQWLADRDQQRQRSEQATADLRDRLDLPHTPFRIEGYDIATLGGNQNVGSMVVFIDGRPSKKDYRQFKVRLETDAPNDYDMMREVLTRRLQRAVEGDEKFLPLPDLLVVDGGKGQLGVARDVLNELGCQHIPLASLAKQQEHIFVPGRSEPIVLEARMPALRLLRALRDEAHRVANTFHQRLRRGSSLRSVLDDIPGVGGKRRTELLTHFRSTEAIAAASVEEIAALPGLNRPIAEQIKAFLSQEQVGEED